MYLSYFDQGNVQLMVQNYQKYLDHHLWSGILLKELLHLKMFEEKN